MSRNRDETLRSTVTLSDVATLAGVSIATASKALNGRDQVKASTRETGIRRGAKPELHAQPLREGAQREAHGNDRHAQQRPRQSLRAPRSPRRGGRVRRGRHLRAPVRRARRCGPRAAPPEYACSPAASTASWCSAARPTLDRPSPQAFRCRWCTRTRPPTRTRTPRSRPTTTWRASSPSSISSIAAGTRSRSSTASRLTPPRRTVQPARSTRWPRAGSTLEGSDGLYGQWTESWGRQCTATLLASGRTIDGIVAASDQIARGVIDQLRESGLRVPEDVAVIGVDNWDILAQSARPPLSSIDMQLQELGRAAARALSTAIGGASSPGVNRLPVRVVPRESTASIE